MRAFIINAIACIFVAQTAVLHAMNIEVTIGISKDWALVEKDKLCLFYIKDGLPPEVVTSGELTKAQHHFLSLAIQEGRRIAKQQNIYTTHWHLSNGSLKQQIKSDTNQSHQ